MARKTLPEGHKTKTDAGSRGFLSLLRPDDHVFHKAWETMIKSYYGMLTVWFFSSFYSQKHEISALKLTIYGQRHGCYGNRTAAMDWMPKDTNA